MHGEAKLLLKFLDGSDNRYIIPVYQRNYDWKQKQCEQLYNDLIQIIKKDRNTHFFGSVVTSAANKGGKSDYLVIDGQQRITTISILFTAMVNLMKSGVVTPEDARLAEKIEKNTDYNVSGFIRNYLTLIQKKIPNINNVYFTFKKYVQETMNIENADDCEAILQDMLYYAQIYGRIITAKNDPKDTVSSILYRLNNIEMTVSYPFLLAMFGHEKRGEIDFTDVESTLKVLETYICRRIMCPNYTSNALNKVFCTLDSEVMKLKTDNSEATYSSILIYYLLSRSGSAGFPNDKEFIDSLTNRDVYHIFKKNREYILDRFENGNTVERVNVIEMMENGDLTIEHIMPQTLTDDWKKELGNDYQSIYDQNIHTLKNLTLTGYNSIFSNNPFAFKKTCEGGFKDSGLNLNKPLLDYDHWTSSEMQDRLEKLLKQADSLWPLSKK